jgi:hypothetical protein
MGGYPCGHRAAAFPTNVGRGSELLVWRPRWSCLLPDYSGSGEILSVLLLIFEKEDSRAEAQPFRFQRRQAQYECKPKRLRDKTTQALCLSKKPRRVSPPERRNKIGLFLGAACTCPKLLLRLQASDRPPIADGEARGRTASPFVEKGGCTGNSGRRMRYLEQFMQFAFIFWGK